MSKFFAVTLIVFSVTSCATVLDGRKQQLAFDSNEKGVEILIDGNPVCKTPCITEVKRKKNKLMVTAKKAGYNDKTIFIDGMLNSTTVINIISVWSATFGFSTDISTGSMWQYQPNSIYVTMLKEPRTAAEKRAQEHQNKIRDFVLRNFDQLQNDAYNNENNGEYIKALADLSQIPEYEIKASLQNSFAAPDAAERIVGRHLSAASK